MILVFIKLTQKLIEIIKLYEKWSILLTHKGWYAIKTKETKPNIYNLKLCLANIFNKLIQRLI